MNTKQEKLYNVLQELRFWPQEDRNKAYHFEKTQQTEEDKLNLLNKYLLYSEHRLQLFEWLLTQYDKYILDKNVISISSSGSERIRRIRDILMELGLFATNKYTKNVDYIKVVDGVAGADASINLFYQLAKFVLASKDPEDFDSQDSVQLINDLCQNKNQLINSNLNLFPLDFPKRFDYHHEDITKELEKLQKKIFNEISKLDEEKLQNMSENEEKSMEIAYAKPEVKALYEQRLNALKNNLIEFVEENKLKRMKIKNMITRFETNTIKFPDKLVEYVDQLIEMKENIENLDKQIIDDNVIEKLQELEKIANPNNIC